MPDAWKADVAAWVAELLGQRLAPPDAAWWPWVAGGVGVAVVALGLLLLWWMLAGWRRRWRLLRLQVALLGTRQGRRAVAVSRRIFRSGHAFLELLERAELPQAERRNLLRLVQHFLREDLPDALRQLLVFGRMSRARSAELLTRQLTSQTRHWSALPEGASRDALLQDIAQTRHRLAQVQAPIDNGRALLEGLEAAADALDVLTAETASLGANRSQALRRFRGTVSEVADGLREEARAHLELEQGR
jgi:hypothetical protein